MAVRRKISGNCFRSKSERLKVTRNEIKRRFPNAVESFILRNLDPVGSVEAGQSKPAPLRPLDIAKPQREKRKGRVGIIITLISCIGREFDDDGNVAALKPLRDAIADSLGIDDGDKRLRWEYGQAESRGQLGVVVKIERLSE